jgi:hypothetical protein
MIAKRRYFILPFAVTTPVCRHPSASPPCDVAADKHIFTFGRHHSTFEFRLRPPLSDA